MQAYLRVFQQKKKSFKKSKHACFCILNIMTKIQ